MSENKIENNEKKPERGSKKNLGKNLLVCIGILLIVGLGVWFGRDALPGPAATVNGEIVTKAEYETRTLQIENLYRMQLGMSGDTQGVEDEEIQAQIKNRAMTELVNETLFLQSAAEANIAVADADVQTELDLYKGSYADERTYREDLKRFKMSEATLRNSIRNQLIIVTYARSIIPVESYTITDDEMGELYMMNYGRELAADPDGTNELIPTFEEFAEAHRAQFELQKLGMLVEPFVQELREQATIEIHVDIPELSPGGTPDAILETDTAAEAETEINEE